MDSLVRLDRPALMALPGPPDPLALPGRLGRPALLDPPDQLALLELLALPELPALPGLLEWRVPPQLSPSHRERR